MRLEWIFPVIVLIFYVLGAIMKAREEARKPKRVGGGGQPGKELDRFLEEIERLRREQSTRQTQGNDLPPRDRPASNRQATAGSPRPVLPPRPPLVVSAPVAPPPVVPAPRPLPPPPPVVAPMTSARSGPNLLQPVLAMLRNHRSLPAAVVLHEIFAPPKGRRATAGGLAAPVPNQLVPPPESTP